MRSQTFRSNIKLFMHSPSIRFWVHYNTTQTKCSLKRKSILQFYWERANQFEWERERGREWEKSRCLFVSIQIVCLLSLLFLWRLKTRTEKQLAWTKKNVESCCYEIIKENKKRRRKKMFNIYSTFGWCWEIIESNMNFMYWTEWNWMARERAIFLLLFLLLFAFDFGILCVGV